MPESDGARPAPASIGWLAGLALAGAGAILFAVAFPPLGAWPLVLVAPAPLAWLAVRARTGRIAVVATSVGGLTVWLWLHHWMVVVTAVGYPFLAAYMTLFLVAFVVVIRRLARHPRLGRLPLALTVPVAWTAQEFLRGEILFDGFGWHQLAHPLIDATAAVQSADLLGTYFIGSLAASVAGAVVDLLRGTREPAVRRRAIAAAAVVATLHAANLVYGVVRLRGTPGGAPGATLLVIQTNLPQNNKMAWTPEAQSRDVASFLSLTRRAAETDGAEVDLIVWPETMLPVHGLEAETRATLRAFGQELELTFAEAVLDLGETLDTPMLVGSPCFVGLDVDREQGRWTWRRHYNSAYLLDGRRVLQRYDKTFLTPFGEVMPYISRWTWLEERLLALGAAGMSFSLDANPETRRLVVPRAEGDLTLATPICFEATVGRVCRRLVHEGGRKRVDVLVSPSNDGWFAGDDGGRIHHAQMPRFRCIENRVPLVRCANTGVSISVDSAGRVVGTIGAGRYGEPRREGWLRAPVVLDDRATVYGRIGEAWPLACLAATVLLTVGTAFGRATG